MSADGEEPCRRKATHLWKIALGGERPRPRVSTRVGRNENSVCSIVGRRAVAAAWAAEKKNLWLSPFRGRNPQARHSGCRSFEGRLRWLQLAPPIRSGILETRQELVKNSVKESLKPSAKSIKISVTSNDPTTVCFNPTLFREVKKIAQNSDPTAVMTPR